MRATIRPVDDLPVGDARRVRETIEARIRNLRRSDKEGRRKIMREGEFGRAICSAIREEGRSRFVRRARTVVREHGEFKYHRDGHCSLYRR